MKIFVTSLMMFCALVLFGQDCKYVNLHGAIKDTVSKQTFYNLFIVNKTAGRGVFGKPDGTFSIQVNPGDSIYFTISGYQTIRMQAVADSSCRHEMLQYVNPLEYKKQEVVVYPLKTLNQIKEERERLARVETRMVTGFDAMKSPITALYQEFSRRERMKKKLAELELQDDINRVVKELIRVYVSYDVMDLEEEEFNDFIRFMNLNEEFLKISSDYQLVTYMKEKYIHYRRLKNGDGYIYNPKNTENVEEN